MDTPALAARPHALALLFGRRRLRFTLLFSTGIGLVLGLGWESGLLSLLLRTTIIGLVALLAFGLLEQWPRRLPAWCARWVLQVVAVGVSMPLCVFTIYVLSTDAGAPPFWAVEDRLIGFGLLTFFSTLLAPWAALAALVRQKDALARHQALAFELEKSQLERKALDARLNLLQAQVAPHFLFNTLANVQALVEAGSPRAPALLGRLIEYLRAAVPRLDEAAATLDEELRRVEAYLELMHMRMPDRLRYALHVDEAARAVRCPPMTLLSLVENAVRHGIDPAEDGGTIEIRVELHGEHCVARVSDTGIGLHANGNGLGTGLATLRERLRLVYGEGAALRISALEPRGVCAEIELPTRGAPV